MESNILIATALNGHIRVHLADTSKLIEDARVAHDLWPSSCGALGRALSITAIMGSMLKNDVENITTTINGGGSIGSIVCCANGKGEVKGFCGDSHIYLKRNSDNSLIIDEIIGKNGYLKVIKDLKLKNNYVSEVRLQKGDISQDFAYYFATSEQTPTIIMPGVLIGNENEVVSAGCLFIELMPGHSEDDINYLESKMDYLKAHPISSVIKENDHGISFLKELFDDLIILDKRDIKYYCGCSRDKFYNNLKVLPKTDIEEICNDEQIEIKCEFCNKKYVFTKDEIKKLL